MEKVKIITRLGETMAEPYVKTTYYVNKINAFTDLEVGEIVKVNGKDMLYCGHDDNLVVLRLTQEDREKLIKEIYLQSKE